MERLKSLVMWKTITSILYSPTPEPKDPILLDLLPTEIILKIGETLNTVDAYNLSRSLTNVDYKALFKRMQSHKVLWVIQHPHNKNAYRIYLNSYFHQPRINTSSKYFSFRNVNGHINECDKDPSNKLWYSAFINPGLKASRLGTVPVSYILGEVLYKVYEHHRNMDEIFFGILAALSRRESCSLYYNNNKWHVNLYDCTNKTEL